MRPIAFIALGDVDETRLLQHLQMTAEIAVGQSAEQLEIGERQSFRMRHQRSQEPKPRLLVDDAVETVVGERCAVSLRHRPLPRQSTGSPPSATGPRQTAT